MIRRTKHQPGLNCGRENPPPQQRETVRAGEGLSEGGAGPVPALSSSSGIKRREGEGERSIDRLIRDRKRERERELLSSVVLVVVMYASALRLGSSPSART